MREAARTASNANRDTSDADDHQDPPQRRRDASSIQAGFALVSGWLTVAMAGGGKWAG